MSSGKGRVGCLFALLLVMVGVYYGIPIVKGYWNYYKLIEEMKTNARFGLTWSDEELLRRLRGAVVGLDLPEDAKRFTIRRSKSPPTVIIQSQYRQRIELPFHHRFITFRPSVEARQ